MHELWSAYCRFNTYYCCFPPPSRALGACQEGELVGMGRIVGLGKRMTQSTRAVAGSQPSPAHGLGLGQQQKNNTLSKQPGPQSSPPPAPSTLQPQCPGGQAFVPTHPCSGMLGALGPTVPSAWLGNKVPLKWHRGTSLLLPGDAFVSTQLPEPSSKLIAAPTDTSGRLSLKKGKNQKELQGLLYPLPITPNLFGLSCTPLAMAELRIAGTHLAFTNNSLCDLEHLLWASFPSFVK